jgi:hypothetical protein
MVDERLRDLPDLRSHRAAILRGLRQLAQDAERAGAVYCAACADRVGDDGSLLASLMVFSTAGMPEPGLNTVEAIAAQIPALAPAGDRPDWREVRVIELPAGRAVRVAGVTAMSADGGQVLPVVTMQTLAPIPSGDGVLNVVLTSPQAAFAAVLLDLFDAISGTLAWEEGPPAR